MFETVAAMRATVRDEDSLERDSSSKPTALEASLCRRVDGSDANQLLIHELLAVSQRLRKRIEEAFGWMKTIALQRKTKFRGVDRVGWSFAFAAAAYNLVRLPKLIMVKTA